MKYKVSELVRTILYHTNYYEIEASSEAEALELFNNKDEYRVAKILDSMNEEIVYGPHINLIK